MEKRTIAADPNVKLIGTERMYITDSNPGLAAAAFPRVWERGFTGAAAPVAIVDTGVWDGHPEFRDAKIDSAVFLEAGRKHPCFDDDATTTRDLQGHGTRTASILLSAAPGLQTLYSLKAGFKPKTAIPGCPASDGVLLSTDIFDALDYAVRQTPVKVVNLSLGAPAQGDDDLMAKVMDYVAQVYGVTLVFSAGNSGTDATVNSPGISYNGITVANLDALGNVHFSSTRGPTPGLRRKPDLAAVGVSIPAADAFSTGTTVATGTSAAAPLVSAAAALLYEAGLDDPLALKALLLNSAGQSTWRSDAGWGPLRLDTAFPNRFQTLATQGPRYFAAVFHQPARGTLVWHRTVNTSAPDAPSPLLPLTLIAYQQRGLEVARAGPEANGNVLRLDLPPGEYILQIDTASEAYAMAWDQPGLTNASAPAIAMSCAYPGTIAAAQPVEISCTASNTGGLPLSNVTGTLLAPLGFGSGGPQSFGTLAPGASRTISWTVSAATATGQYTLSANVTASGFGANLTAEASPMPPIQVTPATNPSALFPVASTGAPVEIRNPGPQPWSIRSLPPFATATVNGAKIEFQPATTSGSGNYTVSNGTTTLTGTIAFNLAPIVLPAIDSARLAVEPSMSAGCPAPEAISVVSEAASPAVWFLARSVRNGDRALVRWVRPNGAVAAQSSLAMPSEGGDYCFSAAAPSLLEARGTWTAEVFWNGVRQTRVRFEVRERINVYHDAFNWRGFAIGLFLSGQPDSLRYFYVQPDGVRLRDRPETPLAGEWIVEIYTDHALAASVPVTIAAPVAIPYAGIKDNTLDFESDREMQVRFVSPSGRIAHETRSDTGIVPLPESEEQGLWEARLIADSVTVRVIPFDRLPFPIYSAAMDREQYGPLDARATLRIEAEQPLSAVYVHEATGKQVNGSLPIAGSVGARYTGKWEARAVNGDGVIFARVPFTVTGPGAQANGTTWAPWLP